MSDSLSYIAIELGADCIRWAEATDGREFAKTIPLPESVWQQIPAENRMEILTGDILSHISSQENMTHGQQVRLLRRI